jgi:hypothetical protein
MKRWPLVLALVAWGCVPAGLVFACRYNVRDVGFVDLAAEPYQLYGYVRADTPADLRAQLVEGVSTSLRDCNIQFELVDADATPPHPALGFLAGGRTAVFPAAVLVSPDGPTLPLALPPWNPSFRPALDKVLDGIASSPLREELLRQVTRSFGVILLLEGPSAEENQQARRAAADAIDQVHAQMKALPKTIAQPPVTVVLDAPSAAGEQVLLWSLGLAGEPAREARAAVVYGRARWMGPIMRGAQISAANLAGLLAIIGADCECGLDLSWTLGTRLPVRWGESHSAQVTRSLGFDPENPLVKIEVSRIVGRGGLTTTPATGYQELSLDDVSGAVGQGGVRTASPLPMPPSTPLQPAPRTAVAVATVSPARTALWSMAGVMVLALGIGAGILWRAARKRGSE